MTDLQVILIKRSYEMASRLNEFTKNYLIAALWSSHEDDGEPLDNRFVISDFHPNALAEAIIDCHDFVKKHGIPRYGHKEFSDKELAGHDFWLTRNHHGSGYWDSDLLDDDMAERLTKGAQKFHELDIYIGDDGMLHFQQA